MAARIATNRLDAVRRAATVSLRFERRGTDYAFTTFLDGNGNGVRTADISAGVDKPIAAAGSRGCRSWALRTKAMHVGRGAPHLKPRFLIHIHRPFVAAAARPSLCL
jgi:hypothetical protein